jgi:16S rRNA processing protein RimM
VLLERGDERRAAMVVAAQPHGRGLLLVTLDACDDRDAAEALVGFRVLVEAEALPPPAEDEFYWHEVIGWRVETTAGATIGTIAECLATGANDVWVVRGGAREHLIPVIADVVRSIDREGGRVVIEPLPGLLD